MLSRWFRKSKLSKPPSAEDETVVVPIPPLVVLLDALQRQKGRLLTREEVMEIRDNAACIVMSRAHAEKWAETRGSDLNPENVWEDWNAYLSNREKGD